MSCLTRQENKLEKNEKNKKYIGGVYNPRKCLLVWAERRVVYCCISNTKGLLQSGLMVCEAISVSSLSLITAYGSAFLVFKKERNNTLGSVTW